MNQQRQGGLTIIEVLAAVTLISITILMVLPLFPTSMAADASSRTRAQAITAAETWLDRYRRGLEPTTSGGPCRLNGNAITCTYPTNHDYRNDTIASHAAASTQLTEQLKNFTSAITARPLRATGSYTQWQITARVSWTEKGTDKYVELTTRALQ